MKDVRSFLLHQYLVCVSVVKIKGDLGNGVACEKFVSYFIQVFVI